MMDFLGRQEARIYALARIVVGFLFASHGGQKLLGILSGAESQMPEVMRYAATGIELVGGILIMLGLFTRWSAFVCSGQMAVAYFMVHQLQGVLPLQNGGELAALYCWIFLFFAARGAGVWSADAARSVGAVGGEG